MVYITYMADKTEAEFQVRVRVGMLYVLADAGAELLTFAAVLVFLRRVAKVDAARVGFFLLQRHWMYY